MRLTTRLRPSFAASSMTGGASVVNLVSMTAFRSTTIVPGYSAAKAALLALTRNLAVHWAARASESTRWPRPHRHSHDRADEIAPGAARRRNRQRDHAAHGDVPRRWRRPSSSFAVTPPPSPPGPVFAGRWRLPGPLSAGASAQGPDNDQRDPHRRPGRPGSERRAARWPSSTASRHPPTSSIDAVCAVSLGPHRPRRLRAGDFRERLGLQLAEMDADEERTGLGRMLMFGDCTRHAANRLLIRDLLHTAPRDPRHPDHTAGDRGRAPPFGNDPPGEPPGRRQPVPVNAAVGVLRAGPEPQGAQRSRRRRSPLDSLRRHVAGDAGGRALRGGHAPDGTRPRARGDRAPDARLLQLHPRVGGPGAAVARLLPRPRPDVALLLHEDSAADHAVVPPAAIAGCSSLPSTSSSCDRCWRRFQTPRSWSPTAIRWRSSSRP